MTTERIGVLSKEQTAEMGCLRRVLDVTLHDKEHRSEMRKTQDVKLLSKLRDPSDVSLAMYPECPRKE